MRCVRAISMLRIQARADEKREHETDLNLAHPSVSEGDLTDDGTQLPFCTILLSICNRCDRSLRCDPREHQIDLACLAL